jgi:MFS transporter, DHA2 family, multidrug resistance protein
MNKWIIAISVILPTLIEVIDTSVVNVSLGHIRGSLSAGLDEATWAITAYLVSNAIVIPMTGWLSRLFGRKRYLIGSITLFTISSFLCGSSKSLGALVFFRILQGIGGGGLQPLSQSILLETFPVAQHGMAMAIFGIGVMFGPIIGPLLGGWITDNWSWNWIFYINIPIGIISILMVMLFIQDPPYLKRIKAQIDYWGLCLITVGLGCLQIVLDKGQREDWFSSSFIVWFSLVSAVSLILFVIVELRSKEPIVNLRVFRNISFASGNFIQAISFFVLFGSIVLLPLYLQQLMGYTAFLAGLALAPGGVATLIAMPTAGKLVTKVNPRWILFSGLLLTASSMFMMSEFNLNVDLPTIIWTRVVMGFGLGFVFIPLISMAFSSIPKEEMGNATSVFSLLRNLGGSFGVAFITTFLAVRAQVHQFHFAEHLNPLDLHYRIGINQATSALMAKAGSTGIAKDALIYQQLLKQSGMNAYRDTFFISGVIMLGIIPLIFLLKQSKQKNAPLVH